MLLKVISGGQTGADRAGLDAAKACGIPTGGWATKGYLIQTYEGTNVSDPSLKDLGLLEMPSKSYPPRTRQNVKDSDGTVWFGFGSSPGGKITLGECRKLNRPVIEFSLRRKPNPFKLMDWLEENQIQVLNVAGNRVSKWNPDIYEKTFRFLNKTFAAYRLAHHALGTGHTDVTAQDIEWAEGIISAARSSSQE